MATKAEIVSAAYIKISGGYPTADLSTWYDDVDFLLAPAVNFVLTKQYFIDKNDEGDRLLQPLFIQAYTVDVEDDQERGMRKITLPKKPITLPGGRGVQFIGSLRGQAYIPLAPNGGSMQQYYSKHKKKQTSYELEGMTAYLYNAQPLVDKARVKMMVDVSDLNDNDELMLPSGAELEVIDILVEFFTGQRALPKDYINSGKEATDGAN